MLDNNPNKQKCIGILGRLLGHKYKTLSTVGGIYDCCLRCGKAHQ